MTKVPAWYSPVTRQLHPLPEGSVVLPPDTGERGWDAHEPECFLYGPSWALTVEGTPCICARLRSHGQAVQEACRAEAQAAVQEERNRVMQEWAESLDTVAERFIASRAVERERERVRTGINALSARRHPLVAEGDICPDCRGAALRIVDEAST